jgi:hypothetical protein
MRAFLGFFHDRQSFLNLLNLSSGSTPLGKVTGAAHSTRRHRLRRQLGRPTIGHGLGRGNVRLYLDRSQ